MVRTFSRFVVVVAASILMSACGGGLEETGAPQDSVVPEADSPVIQVVDGEDELGETSQALTSAPSCIHRGVDQGTWSGNVWLYNQCSRGYWLKVRVSARRDSDCFYLYPSTGVYVSWTWPGGYDGTFICN